MNNCAGGCGPGIQRLPLERPTLVLDAGASVQLTLCAPAYDNPNTIYLDVWVQQKADNHFAVKHHEIARQQFVVKERSEKTFQRRPEKKYTTTEIDNEAGEYLVQMWPFDLRY